MLSLPQSTIAVFKELNRTSRFTVLVLICCILLGKFAVYAESWKQEEFVIGTFWDATGLLEGINRGIYPQPPDTPTAVDIQVLNTYRDAYFNLLTCTGDQMVSNYAENVYVLRTIDSLDDNLRMLVHDWRIGGTEWPQWRDSDGALHALTTADVAGAIGEYNELARIKPDLARHIEGYLLCDEPKHEQIAEGRVLPQVMRLVRQIDPGKLPYVNLFGNRTPPFLTPEGYRPDLYRDYLDRLVRAGGTVLSFDNYAVVTDGEKQYLRNRFFENRHSVAEKSREYGVPFWGMVLSIEHHAPYKEGGARHWVDGPNDYRIGISEAFMRFAAYTPVIYGAKGIIWYEYAPEKDKHGWDWDSRAFVDSLGNPTVSGSLPIYRWGREINRALTHMGPTIMNLDWLGTYHGSSRNNMDALAFSTNCRGYRGCNDKPHPMTVTRETGLVTVHDSSAPVIESVTCLTGNNDIVAVGVFTDGDDHFLMIMNKEYRIPVAQTFRVELEESAHTIFRHAKIVGDWERVGTGTQFTISVEPGDMEMIRLQQ